MDAPRVRRVDVVLATVIAVALVVVMAVIGSDPEPGLRSFDVLAGVLVAVAGGVLALHRRAPLVVLAVTTAALATYNLLEYTGGPVYLTWIGAVFAVSVARGPAKAWVPAAVSTAVILVTGFLWRDQPVGQKLADSAGVVAALFASWAVGALLLGGSVRGRRAERAAMEERARHLAETREEEARRRVAEERLRIARDLHDSVAHSLASFSVQAGVGAHVLDDRPEDARAALLAIKRASGEALAELRATLGMLRSSEAAPREPTAGIDRLPSLVESSRAAGLPVDVVIEGEARPLPPPVDAAAFRIVQESLTNVIRHAGAARATVAVRHGDGGVEIEVTDDGRGAVAGNGRGNGNGGHGLAGMRERVAHLGGELFAGAGRSGGFRVRARLPL
ncbi:MAG TPA: histidine kinase [Acidimicrobiales bacterium]|nr:histidine kinase [Acidimicrobiales bacterium]